MSGNKHKCFTLGKLMAGATLAAVPKFAPLVAEHVSGISTTEVLSKLADKAKKTKRPQE